MTTFFYVFIVFMVLFIAAFGVAMTVLATRCDREADFDTHVDEAVELANSRTHLRSVQ